MRCLRRWRRSTAQRCTFVQVDADKGEELVDRFGVGAVPTYIVLKPDLSVATRVEGADAAKLTEAVRAIAADAPESNAATSAPVLSIEDRLRALINKAPVMLFMKGSPGTIFFFFDFQMETNQLLMTLIYSGTEMWI
jgi:thioredoxin-like negative regulator of GroEL